MDPFDDCPWLLARELFRRLGFEPLPPCAIDDFQLRGRLWEFIYALAARRFYLHDTNHLSDRQAYIWLYDQWLNHEVADIPPETEWNCHANPAEYEPGGGTLTWLRYYADEETRNKWSIDSPDDEVPQHEDPPYDRDRWLPGPPIPLQPVEFDETETELFEGEPESCDPDPLGLEVVDAQIAAHHNAEELAAITGGEQPEGWQLPIDKLERTAGTLLPPDEPKDETLTAKLWELLHNLACQGFYVQHTHYLSDRQLYAELWHRGLREESLLPGKCQTGGWFHDLLGSWGEEEMQLWLRFYASDDERASHARDFPKDPIPQKEAPAHNRDWRLPKGAF